MSVETITATDVQRATREMQIDFLFLDLATCTRCRGTDRSLSEALTVVAGLLRSAGIEVKVNKVHVATEEVARAWRFLSSPTIRVDGADIALELRESSCDSCGSGACTDGCGEQIACRVWVFHGQEYTEPPAELIVDAILRHVYAGPPAGAREQQYEIPANLRRFFAGKEAATRPVASVGDSQATETALACCPSAEQETCCEASEMETCCGADTGQGCGCQ